MDLSTIYNKFNVRPFSGKIYFTYDDLSKLPEFPEGPLIEILQGDLYMVPSPSIVHQTISRKLVVKIGTFLEKNPLGQIFHSPVDVVFSDEEVTIPDLVYIANENSKIITAKNIRGSPDFIIEILSSNRSQDLELKRIIYEKNQVREYWTVDPLEKSILVFILKNNRFQKPLIYYKDDVLLSKVITGFSIELKEIFS